MTPVTLLVTSYVQRVAVAGTQKTTSSSINLPVFSTLENFLSVVTDLHWRGRPAVRGHRSECRLLSNEVAFSLPVAEPKARHRVSPVLVILFLVSYALLVLLITEQGRTIMSQRVLIQQLLQDSTELSHLKVQVQQQKRAEAKPPAKVQPKKAIPSIQVPPQEQSKTDMEARPLRQHPPRPSSDVQDVRRRVFSI